MKIEKIKENLVGLETYMEEFENEIISCFEDYSFNDVTEIIISRHSTHYTYQVYANDRNAPIIGLITETDGENIKIVKAEIL
jgi:hypothetical protein